MRCAGCGKRAIHRHHTTHAQHIRAHGGNPKDKRALLGVCGACHAAHHARTAPLPLRVLSDANYEFARELLGAFAHGYLARHYAGRDPRHDALLEVSDTAA